jgi:hypothetical protein
LYVLFSMLSSWCVMKYFSSYVLSHSCIYTTLYIVCTVSCMSVIRWIYFMFSSICSIQSQFWKYFISGLLLEWTTCPCTRIYKWYFISLLLCESVLHVVEKLSQQTPLRMLKNCCMFSSGSFAAIWILCASVLEHCLSHLYRCVGMNNNWGKIVAVFMW